MRSVRSTNSNPTQAKYKVNTNTNARYWCVVLRSAHETRGPVSYYLVLNTLTCYGPRYLFFAVVLVALLRRMSFISYRITLRLDDVVFTRIENVYVAFHVLAGAGIVDLFIRIYCLSPSV